jgi:hypothetical protein
MMVSVILKISGKQLSGMTLNDIDNYEFIARYIMSTNIASVSSRKVELVVHVDDYLGESRRQDIEQALEGDQGVFKANFTTNRPHLMLVEYDAVELSSSDVLSKVNEQSVHAELVGPI